MGAEVIIFGQSLNSHFHRGLTHCAIVLFYDLGSKYSSKKLPVQWTPAFFSFSYIFLRGAQTPILILTSICILARSRRKVPLSWCLFTTCFFEGGTPKSGGGLINPGTGDASFDKLQRTASSRNSEFQPALKKSFDTLQSFEEAVQSLEARPQVQNSNRLSRNLPSSGTKWKIVNSF